MTSCYSVECHESQSAYVCSTQPTHSHNYPSAWKSSPPDVFCACDSLCATCALLTSSLYENTEGERNFARGMNKLVPHIDFFCKSTCKLSNFYLVPLICWRREPFFCFVQMSVDNKIFHVMQRHRHRQHKQNQMFFQIYVYICYSLINFFFYIYI